MRAMVLPECGKPLELVELPTPSPASGEVLVKVTAAGVCQTDVHLQSGHPAILPSLPWTLGHEVAGVVEEVGSGVTGFEPGTAVTVFGGWGCGLCQYCLGGVEQLCDVRRWQGLGRPGGFADYVLVPAARQLVPIGDLDPVVAAPLTDAGLTSYRAVRGALDRLTPGTTAVVIGLGGLGQFAVQYLRLLSPATVIGVDLAADKRATAIGLGAHATVNPTSEGALEEIRSLTGGTGAAVVFDVVAAAATLELSVSVLGKRGLFVVVGASGETLHLPLRGLQAETTVRTSVWGTRNELADVVSLTRQGLVQATVTSYPLTAAQDALDDLAAGRVAGRAVLVP